MAQANNAVATGKKRANSVVSVTREGDLIHVDVLGQPRLTVDTKKVSRENREYAAFHGFKQRLVDAAAIAVDEFGKTATPAEKYAAVAKIAEHLNSGTPDWNMTKGEGGQVGGVTIKAVAAIQGVEVDVMRERIDELAEKKGLTSKAILAQLAKSPDVIRKIAELRAAASPVDADDLMAELEG
jgi:hypothetical protein